MQHKHWETGQPCDCTFTTHRTSKRIPRPTNHKNPWGDPCGCPWFKPDHKEHVGATKEAAKIDWLRERPDVQKDLRKRLIVNQHFPQYHERADSLLPWILREYNKGGLKLYPRSEETVGLAEDAERKYHDYIRNGGDPNDETGQMLKQDAETGMGLAEKHVQTNGLIDAREDPAIYHAHRFTPMLEDLKKRGQGVDLMQHSWPEVQRKFEDWDAKRKQREEEERRLNNGQIVHHWPEGPNKGWSVRRLRDKDECDLEGELMGNCVGSYGGDVEEGRTNIFSLRDHKNEPHATTEIRPMNGRNPEDPEQWRIPEPAWGQLPMKKFQGVPIQNIRDYHDLVNEYGLYRRLDEHPARNAYFPFMEKAVESGMAMPPISEGEVVQTQGKGNEAPLHEYTNMLDEFMGPHGLDSSYKPWWDDEYEMEGPQDFRDFLGYTGGYGRGGNTFGHQGYPEDDWHEGIPEEYRMAEYEAMERGLDPPELHVGDPDYHGILDSLIDPQEPRYGEEPHRPWRGYNPRAGQYVLDQAQYLGRYGANHQEDLASALQTHMGETQVPTFQPSQELLQIQDPFQRQKALEEAEKRFYEEQGLDDDPYIHMFNHLGPQLIPGYEPSYGYQPQAQIHPEQQNLWQQDTGQPWTNEYYNDGLPNPGTHPYGRFPSPLINAKVSSLYERWVFSPSSGQVELSDNQGDPLKVDYHTDLAGRLNEPNLVHGYAYRIGNGWRLTDYDHAPVTDPFVIAQVMRALQGQNEQPSDDWMDDHMADEWDRMHYGLPS